MNRMASKVRHRTKSKKKRWIILLAGIAFIIALSVAYYLSIKPVQLKQSSKYFRFSDIYATASAATPGSNATILINELTFNLTPVEGDAHDVVIFTSGMTSPQDYYYPQMSNGTSTFVDIPFQYHILSRKQAGGYPIRINKLYCDEATGNVTIVIPENNVIFTTVR